MSYGKWIAVALAAVVAILGGIAVAHGSTSTTRTTAPQTTAPQTTVPKRSIVAQARGKVSVFHHPGAHKAFAHYTSSNGYGQPRVFLVTKRRPGWEKIYLPQRPNGTTGWVRDRVVSLAYDPYTVVVSLSHHSVKVYNAGRRIISAKAGVGRSISSTPSGKYFLVMLLKQPDPKGVYGPYAFGTSAFSNTYYSFGGGPGEIGLHGTNEPQYLGTNVSHGCIRVANSVITRLAKLLPLGTPVLIQH